MTDRAKAAIIRIRRSTTGRIAWVALAKRLVAQDEMLFSRYMRMLPVRYALAKRYCRTSLISLSCFALRLIKGSSLISPTSAEGRDHQTQATGARGGAGQPAGQASQILR